MNSTIFGFDVGLGSLGVAVRQADDIVHADSLLIDAEVATIQSQVERRRQKRTRNIHKKREEWWKKVWEEIGKQTLNGIQMYKENGEWKGTKGDERLEREFAKDGDETVYTSCLLRILLLQGEKLEGWQIYKAIRSAFQRAGYPDVPWAKKQKKDDEDGKKRTLEFDKQLEEIFENEKFRLPCYYDAYQMGLFDPKTGEMKFKQNHSAKRARGYTASRDLVEKELRLLLNQAARQIPELKTVGSNPEKWQEYILFGSEFEAFNDTKIEGVLDQKKARFDNRCVNPCSCIPRFKVTRAEDVLYFQVHFLLKLRNMFVEKERRNQKLTTNEIREWYKKAESERTKYMEGFLKQKKENLKAKIDYKKIANKYKITKTQWKNWCEKQNYKVYTGTPEVLMPKTSGRIGFCRPAMVLLRELILSGESPHDFRQNLVDSYFTGFEKFKLKPDDLDFLLRMKENDPEKIYIVAPTLVEKNIDRNTGDLETAVHNIIGSTRNSVIRHRLEVFFKQLKKLEAVFGTPENIVVEFAREDFSSEQKKKDYTKASNENHKMYEEAQKELANIFGADYRKENHLVRKYIMWKKQGNICPYTGQNIAPRELPNCEIEHVIPQGGKWNGPDAIENTVLTTHSENAKKGNRMPFEYITESEWEAFKNRVERMFPNRKSLSGKIIVPKTKQILLCRSQEEAEKLIDRYYGLAVTGWVARLARDIACVWFGWQPGAEGESRKIHTVSGSLVGKIRRKYGLNKALKPFLTEEEQKKDIKNRDDHRHHALDAMVMTYLNEYMRNPRLFDKLELPEKVRDHKYFAEKLKEVVPHKIARNKARLGETAYRVIEKQEVVEKRGEKVLKKEKITVGRVNVESANPKKIIDPVIRKKIESFLEKKPNEEQKKEFFDNFYVKKIQVEKGKPDNQKNLSKNPYARGQYYESKSISGTGTLQHGVYLYSKKGRNWKVEPIYAFKSPYKTKQDLITQGYEIKDNALFYAGCIIEITEPIEDLDIDRGIHTMQSLNTAGQLMLINSRGQSVRMNEKGKPIPITLGKLKDNFHFIR